MSQFSLTWIHGTTNDQLSFSKTNLLQRRIYSASCRVKTYPTRGSTFPCRDAKPGRLLSQAHQFDDDFALHFQASQFLGTSNRKKNVASEVKIEEPELTLDSNCSWWRLAIDFDYHWLCSSEPLLQPGLPDKFGDIQLPVCRMPIVCHSFPNKHTHCLKVPIGIHLHVLHLRCCQSLEKPSLVLPPPWTFTISSIARSRWAMGKFQPNRSSNASVRMTWPWSLQLHFWLTKIQMLHLQMSISCLWIQLQCLFFLEYSKLNPNQSQISSIDIH